MTKDSVVIYTDGACDPNPGPGGWAAVLCYGRHEKVISGSDPQTTNNRMELQAALSALRALKSALMAIRRSGERSLFVPEQFGFQQARGERSAIHDHERA